MKNNTNTTMTTTESNNLVSVIGHLAQDYKAEIIQSKYGPCKIIRDVCLFDSEKNEKYYFSAVLGDDAEIIENAKTTDNIGIKCRDEVYTDKHGNMRIKMAKVFKTSLQTGNSYYACSTGRMVANLTEASEMTRNYRIQSDSAPVIVSNRGINL